MYINFDNYRGSFYHQILTDIAEKYCAYKFLLTIFEDFRLDQIAIIENLFEQGVAKQPEDIRQLQKLATQYQEGGLQALFIHINEYRYELLEARQEADKTDLIGLVSNLADDFSESQLTFNSLEVSKADFIQRFGRVEALTTNPVQRYHACKLRLALEGDQDTLFRILQRTKDFQISTVRYWDEKLMGIPPPLFEKFSEPEFAYLISQITASYPGSPTKLPALIDGSQKFRPLFERTFDKCYFTSEEEEKLRVSLEAFESYPEGHKQRLFFKIQCHQVFQSIQARRGSYDGELDEIYDEDVARYAHFNQEQK